MPPEHCPCHGKLVEKATNQEKKCDENREDHEKIWERLDFLFDKLDTKVSMKVFLVMLCTVIISGIGVQMKTLQVINSMAVSMAKVETTMSIHFGDDKSKGP
jgi:hypothetical protein